MAPGLVQIHQQFAPLGLQMISITNLSEPSARDFVASHTIVWPSGYHSATEYLARLGTIDRDSRIKGYELIPTLYLIDHHGNVIWSDRQSRFRHRSAAETLKELESILANALNPDR